MDRFYKLKHQNDPVINSLTLKVRPGLHVFLTLRLLWPERWLILRYANVTDVGERSVWHCKLNPLSQLWYGSAFQRGLPGGRGVCAEPANTHSQSDTCNERRLKSQTHFCTTNICNVLVKPDVTTSHLSLQLRFCRSHRCCKMLFSYLGAEKNKYCSVELQWSREPSHFLCISSGLAHVQGRTYYRSTSNKQPGPAEVSSRFIYLKGFYEIYADLEHQLLRNMFKCQPNWQQISDQRNLLTTAETTSKSPASR